MDIGKNGCRRKIEREYSVGKKEIGVNKDERERDRQT